MSIIRQTIIPTGNSIKKFPAGLQELYLEEYDGQKNEKRKLTEENLKQLLRKIHSRKVLDAYLWWNPDGEGDHFNIEVNAGWIAFQYVVNAGMKDGYFYSSFDPEYLNSDKESDTDTIYGGFMPLRYTMHDPKLAAKCVEYFARTGKLYPGMAWLKIEY